MMFKFFFFFNKLTYIQETILDLFSVLQLGN